MNGTKPNDLEFSEWEEFKDALEFNPYHNGPSRPDSIPPEKREFIAWDGEGQNLSGKGKPQSYILFGASTGDYIQSKIHLSVFECIDLIIQVGRKNPQGVHVSYAFGYDANQIVRTLRERTLYRLHKFGSVNLRRRDGSRYRIEWRPTKWFQVTQYHANFHRTKNVHAKTTVRIYDLFGFFQRPFIAAYEKMIGEVPKSVLEGKQNRDDFVNLDSEYVLKYWQDEIECIRRLAEELRRRLYGAGLRITQWHGPGALASYALRTRGMGRHMAKAPDEVRNAARYAYAGGRFEMFSLGRHIGPIYSMDINSAYPDGIRLLPSLAGKQWKYVSGNEILKRRRLAQFGVYRIRLLPNKSVPIFRPDPSPVFHRDPLGNITYPWIVNGWYWSPEARNVLQLPKEWWEIVEGWELEWDRSNTEYPFAWVEEMYNQRRKWKRPEAYKAAEIALKLCLNSLYGKMAQRIGWDQDKKSGPRWHQLEWAGWVTSHTRSTLYRVMRRIGYDNLIAVETDGLYTTIDPRTLGYQNSDELGGWKIEEYDEILYVQSGMAWLRNGDKWTCKRRGLDARTFSLDDCISYLRSLAAQQIWTPFIGEVTRFVGLGSALMAEAPTKVRLGIWETTTREIKPGQNGKRLHMFKQCRACKEGKSAYDGGHDMMINPRSIQMPDSFPHDIPWEGVDDYPWRAALAESEGLVVAK